MLPDGSNPFIHIQNRVRDFGWPPLIPREPRRVDHDDEAHHRDDIAREDDAQRIDQERRTRPRCPELVEPQLMLRWPSPGWKSGGMDEPGEQPEGRHRADE